MKNPTPAKPIKRRRGLHKSQYIDHTIPSPCISLCLLDDTNSFCIGCFRMVDELRDWCIMTAEQKLKILEEIEERKDRLN